jgi:two-component system sensor histidine kinase/response regulator
MMEEKKNKILVVDDEDLNVRFLTTFLTRKGFEIDVASTGVEALERIGQSKPDVVLLDAMMPTMDGFEVCRRLRGSEDTRLLPVIMITALHSIEDEVRALEAGADDFLPKPINNLELMARLRSLLRIKALHDQLQDSKMQLEEKNKKLIELQGLRDSLTQMIVHDLKNPLTGIMGCSELLLMMPENLSEKQVSIVKKIDESASSILNMITDMLDISRMEENKLQLRKQAFHISEILQTNVNDFAMMMEKHHVTSSIEIQDNMPKIEADKDMMHRIVANLLHNAIKHSTRGGTIQVRAAYNSQHSQLHVAVKDHGEGIAPEYTDKIFEKFAQADMKKLGLKTDRGLGLTFCKLAVEAHGGRIRVESKVDEGSEFTFYIPSPAL